MVDGECAGEGKEGDPVNASTIHMNSFLWGMFSGWCVGLVTMMFVWMWADRG